jgi:hypothetical protein
VLNGIIIRVNRATESQLTDQTAPEPFGGASQRGKWVSRIDGSDELIRYRRILLLKTLVVRFVGKPSIPIQKVNPSPSISASFPVFLMVIHRAANHQCPASTL